MREGEIVTIVSSDNRGFEIVDSTGEKHRFNAYSSPEYPTEYTVGRRMRVGVDVGAIDACFTVSLLP